MDSHVLYLKPAIDNFNDSANCVALLIKTINDAISGISSDSTEDDVHFLKLKIGSILLNCKLQTYDNLSYCWSSSDSPICSNFVITWSSFIQISLQCNMMLEVSELLFKLDQNVFCIVLRDIVNCMNVPQCGGEGVLQLNYFDSFVSAVCILCSSIKTIMTETNIIDVENDQCDKVFTGYP